MNYFLDYFLDYHFRDHFRDHRLPVRCAAGQSPRPQTAAMRAQLHELGWLAVPEGWGSSVLARYDRD